MTFWHYLDDLGHHFGPYWIPKGSLVALSADRQTVKQTDRQADRQADRQTGRQADRKGPQSSAARAQTDRPSVFGCS